MPPGGAECLAGASVLVHGTHSDVRTHVSFLRRHTHSRRRFHFVVDTAMPWHTFAITAVCYETLCGCWRAFCERTNNVRAAFTWPNSRSGLWTSGEREEGVRPLRQRFGDFFRLTWRAEAILTEFGWGFGPISSTVGKNGREKKSNQKFQHQKRAPEHKQKSPPLPPIRRSAGGADPNSEFRNLVAQRSLGQRPTWAVLLPRPQKIPISISTRWNPQLADYCTQAGVGPGAAKNSAHKFLGALGRARAGWSARDAKRHFVPRPLTLPHRLCLCSMDSYLLPVQLATTLVGFG